MNHEHGTTGHDHGNSCPMIMTFHFGNCETILWKSLTVTTVTNFVLTTLGFFIIAFIYEYLKYLREKYYHTVAKAELIKITKAINNVKRLQSNVNENLENRYENSNSGGGGGGIDAINNNNNNMNIPATNCCISLSEIESQKTMKQKIFNQAHIFQTLLHLLQITISYMLMLIIMTYNYWLCFAVILGAAAGYFCFGWIKQESVDFNEHCH